MRENERKIFERKPNMTNNRFSMDNSNLSIYNCNNTNRSK